jgi:hypothetical protein
MQVTPPRVRTSDAHLRHISSERLRRIQRRHATDGDVCSDAVESAHHGRRLGHRHCNAVHCDGQADERPPAAPQHHRTQLAVMQRDDIDTPQSMGRLQRAAHVDTTKCHRSSAKEPVYTLRGAH